MICLGSCLPDEDPQIIEKWYLESWEATPSCCVLTSTIKHNEVIDMLLGLEDPAMTETQLHLSNKHEMKLLKNNAITLSGHWDEAVPGILRLTANAHSWNFEILSKNEDSVVLKSQEYYSTDLVNMILKRH
jgi:hypothetical protein